MTTREKLEDMLINCGMFDSQAKEVIDISIPELDEVAGNYRITFDRPANEYPEPIFDILFLHIKPIALKWIKQNKPEAWFKGVFE